MTLEEYTNYIYSLLCPPDSVMQAYKDTFQAKTGSISADGVISWDVATDAKERRALAEVPIQGYKYDTYYLDSELDAVNQWQNEQTIQSAIEDIERQIQALEQVRQDQLEPLSQIRLFANTDCYYYSDNTHIHCAVNPNGCSGCSHFTLEV